MRIQHYIGVLMCVLLAGTTGCKEADIDTEHHYDNKLYISSNTVTDDLFIKPSISSYTRSISYRIAKPEAQDITVSFAAVSSRVATYNLIYKDKAELLDEEFYEIPAPTATIKAGYTTGEEVKVNFQNTNKLDKNKRYVLPVQITQTTGISALESANTVYYLFKGAALINVVANIEKMYFPIQWKSDVQNMDVITVEALVRSSNWSAGRDNALSTVFGIEGSFLVRIGDSDRPRDQLQVVAPGGNFPPSNKVTGLPVNEFVHIAIIYNANTGERSYYRDGVQVYSDNSGGSRVSLSSNCYIGKSWNDSRWLPGEISEVRIWNVQRTQEQIANNTYEVDPQSEGLLAYWRFDEGGGATIKDHTGHGNDIKAVGGTPTWIPVELPKIGK